jgi:hypothetical protein
VIKTFDITTDSEEIKKERAKAGDKYVIINGDEVTIFTGADIPSQD